MKKWEAPELFELKAEWTQNEVNLTGNDSYGETIIIGGNEMELGSCTRWRK